MDDRKLHVKREDTFEIEDIKTDTPEVPIPDQIEVPESHIETPPVVSEWSAGSQNISRTSSEEELNRSTSHGYNPVPFEQPQPQTTQKPSSLPQGQGLDNPEEKKKEEGSGLAPSQVSNGYNNAAPGRNSENIPSSRESGSPSPNDEMAAPDEEAPHTNPSQGHKETPSKQEQPPEEPTRKKDGLGEKDGLDQKEGSKKDKAASPEEEQGRHKPGEKQSGDARSGYNPDDNIRRNLQHNNQVQNDAKRGVAGNESDKPKTPVLPQRGQQASNNPFSNLGNNLRNGLSNGMNKLKNGLNNKMNGGENQNKPKSGGDSGDISRKVGQKIKAAMINLIKKHPSSLLIIFIILIIIFSIFAYEASEYSGGSTHCRYSLSGVTSTGTIDLDSVQVELVNCDATEGNYTVLEMIDFEKYVVGVAIAEVGWHPDYPEYFKTEIVAARNFALTRNSGMCPGHPDDCFYGYNTTTGVIRMRACTNDQVYCDIDKPCYHYPRSGQPTLYGPEAETISGAGVWKGQMSEETKAAILAVAEEVKGKVLIDDNGDVVKTHYVNTDQLAWMDMAKEGKSYEEILVTHYKDDGAAALNSAVCTNVGNIDYGDYVLSSDDATILHQRLDTFLESKGSSLDAFNSLIEKNVKKNGYGTKAGVVAAGVTLIAELSNNYGVKVPYYWSGGHYDGVVVGALGKWGSPSTGGDCYITGNGRVYDYCGLDCSGFVPWAIKNGGFNIAQMLAGNFQNLPGAQRVSLNAGRAVVEPGDLLESSGHIVLVVGIDEPNRQYICAEASGYDYGVQFTRRPFNNSGYWGVKMDGYYNNHVRSQ